MANITRNRVTAAAVAPQTRATPHVLTGLAVLTLSAWCLSGCRGITAPSTVSDVARASVTPDAIHVSEPGIGPNPIPLSLREQDEIKTNGFCQRPSCRIQTQ
jgi:hypothetical protein